MKVVKHGKAQEQRLEELVVIYRGWGNRDLEWEDKASSKCDKPGCNMVARYMVLPTLKILKVAGLLPDICVFLDFLEAPHLESLDVTAYGEDNVINRIYLQMVQSFEDRCELLVRSNVILMPEEPDKYSAYGQSTYLYLGLKSIRFREGSLHILISGSSVAPGICLNRV